MGAGVGMGNGSWVVGAGSPQAEPHLGCRHGHQHSQTRALGFGSDPDSGVFLFNFVLSSLILGVD